MQNATERGLEKRDLNEVYKQLSIDEKSFQKGHNYAGQTLLKIGKLD
jgi:hypothetical protein